MDAWLEWQRNYRHGTFVIWPPSDVRRRINPLRRRYDPESQRICEAHITLTQPLLRAPTPADWDALRAAVAPCSPFTMRYGPLDTFLPYPCIYLRIEPADRVLALRAAMHKTGLCDLSLPYSDGFVPHMSLTDGYPDAAATQALYDELSRGEPLIGDFDCRDVAYIVPDERFCFHVRRRLPLVG